MGLLGYYWRVLRMAWKEGLDLAQLVLFLLFLAAGLATRLLPLRIRHVVPDVTTATFAWWILGAMVLARLAVSPYYLWKKEKERADELAALSQHSPGDPDWTIRELFFHIDPGAVDAGRREVVGQDVLDKLCGMKLTGWGRRLTEEDKLASQSMISFSYWEEAELTYSFLGENAEMTKHVEGPWHQKEIQEYADLRVNRRRALEIWPAPSPPAAPWWRRWLPGTGS